MLVGPHGNGTEWPQLIADFQGEHIPLCCCVKMVPRHCTIPSPYWITRSSNRCARVQWPGTALQSQGGFVQTPAKPRFGLTLQGIRALPVSVGFSRLQAVSLQSSIQPIGLPSSSASCGRGLTLLQQGLSSEPVCMRAQGWHHWPLSFRSGCCSHGTAHLSCQEFPA